MPVEELLRIGGIAASDSLRADTQWQDVEAAFGPLPGDYRTFCSLAGTGSIGEFFWIFDPFTSNVNLNFRHQAVSLVSTAGLLPFGVTTNGELLQWRTTGRPDEWTVSVRIPRAGESFEFDGGMCDFLAAVLTGRVVVPAFPKGLGRLYPPVFRRSS